jgi:LAO/AO transport system kinase
VRDLRHALSLGDRRPGDGGWRPPVCRTVATRETGNGIDAVLDAVDAHRRWLASSGEGVRRRTGRAAREIEAIAVAGLRERMGDVRGTAALRSLAGRVVAGETDPFAAADALLAQL